MGHWSKELDFALLSAKSLVVARLALRLVLTLGLPLMSV